MSPKHFVAGQKLKAIYFADGGEVNITTSSAKSIEVVYESGEYPPPWAIVEKVGINGETEIRKWNLNLCLGVELDPDWKPEESKPNF